MLYGLIAFELYSRWVPLKIEKKENVWSAPCPNANGNGSKRMSETLHRL